MTDKPRVRVPARSSDPATERNSIATRDSFQNFAARVGLGTNTLASGSTYGFNPISRNRTLLEWMYRDAWLVGQVVDVIAEDMTRAGVQIQSDMKPADIDKIHAFLTDAGIWERLTDAIKWSRLYGGSIGVALVKGQKYDTPLRIDTVGKGQFKGLAVLDRWMLQPTLGELITEPGPDLGLPKFYDVVTDGSPLAGEKIHHSRVIRLDGVDLPFYQRQAENGWGLSVVERVFDRMVAFDSTTQGAAQLVFKAHLRTLSVDGLRELIAAGGKLMEGVAAYTENMRLYQSNEGLTLIDAKDTFATHQYSFAGLSDLLMQFGEQLSGASGIPLVRLFGQSPAGLNSSGESDLKTYHDNIGRQQNRKLRQGMALILALACRSTLGVSLPDGFNFVFTPLNQLTEPEKSEIAGKVTTAVTDAADAGIIDKPTALKELRQSARVTGVFSNITDDDIKRAEEERDAEPPEPEGTGDLDLDGNGKADAVKKLLTGDTAASFMLHGLGVVVETAKGAERSGPGWTVTMPAHYGFITGTWSAEGKSEEMDCFIGPDLDSEWVWVIDQLDLATGAFDEHKVMFGYTTPADAARDYIAAFSDGRGFDRMANLQMMSIDELKHWLATGRLDRALAA